MNKGVLYFAGIMLAFGLGLIIAGTQIAQGVIPGPLVTNYDADVNKDTTINSIDLGIVASRFNQSAPTASPTPTATATATPIPSEPVVTTLVQSQYVGVGTWFYSPIVEVDSCNQRMMLSVERSAPAYFDNWILFGLSDDAENVIGSTPTTEIPFDATMTNSFPGFPAWSQQNASTAFLDVTGQNVSRYMRFGVRNGNVAQEITMHLTCQDFSSGSDVVLTEDFIVANHQQAWFGSYRSENCPEAVVYVHAQGTEGPGGTFDFLVARSDDGVSPTAGWANIGNSSTEGPPGEWHVHRKLTMNKSGAEQGGGNIEPYHYDDTTWPYVLVGVFANQGGRFRATVHCGEVE